MEGGKKGRGGENSVKDEVAFLPPPGPHCALAAHRHSFPGPRSFPGRVAWGPIFEQDVDISRDTPPGAKTTAAPPPLGAGQAATASVGTGRVESGFSVAGVWGPRDPYANIGGVLGRVDPSLPSSSISNKGHYYRGSCAFPWEEHRTCVCACVYGRSCVVPSRWCAQPGA